MSLWLPGSCCAAAVPTLSRRSPRQGSVSGVPLVSRRSTPRRRFISGSAPGRKQLSTRQCSTGNARTHPHVLAHNPCTAATPRKEEAPTVTTQGCTLIGTYAFEKIDRDDANDFLDRVVTGENIKLGDPVHAFRAKALRLAAERAVPTALWPALLTKAWNAYRAGDQINSLSFRRGGHAPEGFPEPR